MTIRRAEPIDIPGINKLLLQVLTVHHNGRPDLFKANTKKYTDEELLCIINDESRPIFVAESGGKLCGYAFCVLKEYKNDNIIEDHKTLYIDDLCVDEEMRGQGIGSALYGYVARFAKGAGCYDLTLNVWACNSGAAEFYKKCGLLPQKTCLEKIL